MNNLFDLTDKQILITGANGWLGSAYTKGVLEAGASVIMVDSSPEVNNFRDKLIKTATGNVQSIVVDMYDKAKYKEVLQNLAANNAIDAIINNAFSFGQSNIETGLEGDFETLEDQQWDDALQSGIGWAVNTIKPFLPGMKERQSGSIINICSMYAKIAPNPDMYQGKWKKYMSQATYTTAKTGLLGLTRYLASFLAEYKIRCNALAPGAFSKPGTDQEFIDTLEGLIPLHRIGKPGDLVGAIIYLCSDCSAYMTGECLSIDGGLTIRQ